MSLLFIPPVGKAAAASYLLEQSLLFDGAAYLSRTPGSAGNRKTWTFSCWFKRDASTSAATQILFAGGSVTGANDTNWVQVFISSDGTFGVGGGSTNWRISSAKLADTSAWYHLTVNVDTTQATAADRIKMFLNGVQITSFGTNNAITLNADTGANSVAIHTIGRRDDASRYFSGLMALPILVDGAALDATSFGELDDDGYWNPIAYVTGAEPAAIGATWRGSYSNDSDAASYTNSAAALGTADADRYVIVAIPLFTGPTNLTISSVTIGGVSATKINGETFYSATSTNRSLVDFWKANVPTGTTGDIVITPSTTAPRMSASWWTCIGDVAIIDTQADIATDVTFDNSLTVTSKRPSNGFVLAAITGQGDAGNPTFTWGGTGITENYETGWGDTDATHGSASGDFTAASTEAITVTNGTGNMFYYILSAVTFAPPGGDGAYGTNGGVYDFADTADFGKDVNYTGDTSVTFTDSSVNSGSATTYTFSSQAIGTASADRVVVVGTSGGAGNTNPVSSMTIGGVSAVKAIGIVNSTGTEIWYATVTSGTTASVVVNWGAAKNRCGIGVWALTGVTGVGATNTSTSSTATLTVSGRTKDIVLAVYGGKDHASVTFTGLTEDYDEDISGAGSQYQAGGSKKLTATGSNTITVTPNTGATEVAAVSAVFLATGNNGYFSNNFTASDQLSDTPTDSADDEIGNFATWNPNDGDPVGQFTPSEGNTVATFVTGSCEVFGSLAVTSGKYWFEITLLAKNASSNTYCGIQNTAESNSVWYRMDGAAFDGTTFSGAATYATFTTSDRIGIALDLDAGTPTCAFYKNGSLIFTASAFSGAQVWRPFCYCDLSSTSWKLDAGQFGFVDTPPSGFKALATQNLPAPTIADGSQYFNTVLYTGTGSELAITSLDFTPDFVWIKNRDATDNHMLYDSVRGATKDLHSNTADAETTTAQTLKSFDSAGFTLGTDVQVNTNTEDYVAWCWKANGAGSSNTDGSITATVSANQTVGFSIVKWTQTNANGTIGHGLSQQPELMHVKSLGSGDNWRSWTAYNGSSDTGSLNENGVFGAASPSTWNSGQPGASTFPVGTDTATNGGAGSAVAYLWHSVEGFSKFGSYVGNGSANGPFIYTGFRPACVLTRRVTVSAGSWAIMDNKRNPYNPVNTILFPDLNNADEGPFSYYNIDFVSNGFKIRTSNSQYNVSGSVYIYAAFAEHPFQGAEGYTQARAR
jgi:hypothetical protein